MSRRLGRRIRARLGGAAATEAPRREPPRRSPAAGERGLILDGRWSTESLGLPAHATVRCLLPLPGGPGEIAAGSDYGMALYRGDAWSPFPYPRGARRESQRVEGMAVHDGALYVATTKNWYRWPFEGEAAGRAFPRDTQGYYEEIRTFFAAGDRLWAAWRPGLEQIEVGGGPTRAGDGPAEVVSVAAAPDGRVFAGTLEGALFELGVGLRQTFSRDGRPQPVRHLAWQAGRLHVAAAGALHTGDPADPDSWSAIEGEPYALRTDALDRLWTLRQGSAWLAEGAAPPRRLEEPLERPWSLGATDDGAIWIGEVGRISRFRWGAPG